MSRPTPKRRADTSDVPLDTESVGGKRSASRANREDTARHSRPGARRAARRRSSLVPTPAVLGAAALVIAGGGAVVVSSSGGSDADSYESASPESSLSAGATYARGGGLLPVSRSVDRATLERQTRLQAQQYADAMAELKGQVQKRADELKANQWVLPVVGYSLTSRWGEISSLWSTYHTGLDFATSSGTEIVSIGHGVVIETTYDSAYGYMVKVELDDGTQVWYCHQTDYVVEEGQELNPGDLIGYVGETGNTTGPHLHLEVRVPDGSEDGQDVDPYEAFLEHGVTP